MPVDVTPRTPSWPLRWPDVVLDLPDLLGGDTHGVYLVGGCVRDALLGRPIKDVDIATAGSGVRLARKIANAYGGDFYPLDPERDVGRALVTTAEGPLVFDVAGLRGPDLGADLLDRDFTLNAMAVDLSGALNLLIDPLGGEKDAITRVIRQCGPQSLADDPLRTLRAVRQSVQLKGHIDKQTLLSIRAVAPRLSAVSPERIRDEFFRILALADPAAALRIADVLGLLKIVIPETAQLHTLSISGVDAWTRTLATVDMLKGVLTTIGPQRTDETAAAFSLGMIVMALDVFRSRLQAHIVTTWPDNRPHSALLMLAVLLGDTAAGEDDGPARVAESTAQALRLSNAERQRLVAMVRHHALPRQLSVPTPVTIYRFWKATGEAGVDVCLLSLAQMLGQAGPYLKQDDWIAFLEQVRLLLDAYYEQHDRLVAPPVLVDGKRLMRELHLKPGPVVGDLLERIREAQVSGDVTTPDGALELARRLTAG